jgi:hypothetical protein
VTAEKNKEIRYENKLAEHESLQGRVEKLTPDFLL